MLVCTWKCPTPPELFGAAPPQYGFQEPDPPTTLSIWPLCMLFVWDSIRWVLLLMVLRLHISIVSLMLACVRFARGRWART